MPARIHRSIKVYVVWSIVLLASPYLDAQSAVPELSVQLKAEGYSPESCISSPPSAYVTGDTTVHINVVNDLQVELQPAYLDLDGRLRLLKKRPANSSWNDSTYAQTIWVWLDDTNKKCLGTTQISDVATQSKVIRLSELSSQQIDAITERTQKESSVETIAAESTSNPKKLSVVDRERAALVGFYAATDGPAWRKSDGWLTDINHCEWYGVTCEGGRVTGLELNSNRASGNIPAVIGELRGLERLFLHSNNFMGVLPPEIGNLANLTHLHLGYNALSGPPPSSMSRLRNLQYLYLNDNQFSGPLPAWLANSRLWALGIGNNSFIGDLRRLRGTSRLVYFTAYNNHLRGSLPDFIADWKRLRRFDISGNAFSGEFPATVAHHLASIDEAKISGNKFDCPVPFVIRDALATGKEFCVGFTLQRSYDGWLEGEYAQDSDGYSTSQLAYKSYFEKGLREGMHQRWHPNGELMHQAEYSAGKKDGIWRWWDDNGLQTQEKTYREDKLHGVYRTFKKGEIDKECCYQQGKRVDASSCDPTFEDAPSEEEIRDKERRALVAVYRSTRGQDWRKNDGWLSDSDHCDWYGIKCRDGSVIQLSLMENNLRGELPAAVNDLQALWGLFLSDNQISDFEAPLTNSGLEVIYLGDNNLTGEMPSWLGNLDRLRVLSLSSNKLVGGIPSSLRNAQRLEDLWIHKNMLSGQLPAWLSELPLRHLSVADNRFSGEIPQSLAEDMAALGTWGVRIDENDFDCPLNPLVRDIAAEHGEFCLGDTKSSTFSGQLKADFSNGNQAYLSQFDGGKRVGEQNFWHRNGEIRRTANYSLGKIDGIETTWYPSGNVFTERRYRQGVKHGWHKRWRDDGHQNYEHCYRNGKKIQLDVDEACIEATLVESEAKASDSAEKLSASNIEVETDEVKHEGTVSAVTTSRVEVDAADYAVIEPAPIRNLSADRKAPSVGERLALVVHELNSARRMYNDQYELTEVRMDYDNQELNYLFSVRNSLSELDVSMLAMVAKSTYCSASKLELFREENIPAVWIYADSSGEELRISTWAVDCE